MRWLLFVIPLLLVDPAAAEQPAPVPSANNSAKITTGNTLQTIVAAGSRRSITMQNNQTTTDNCFIIFGANITTQVTPGTTTLSSTVTINGTSMTVQQAAILLTPGLPYQRYYPFVPSDAIYGTCATAGDSIYVDIQ